MKNRYKQLAYKITEIMKQKELMNIIYNYEFYNKYRTEAIGRILDKRDYGEYMKALDEILQYVEEL